VFARIKTLSDYWARLLLVFFILATCGFQIWFALLDQVPPVGDATTHLVNSIRFFSRLTGERNEDWLVGLLTIDKGSAYPPLVYATSSIIYAAGGLDPRWAIISQVFFLALLLAATYGLARRLWDPATGLLAAFLVGTCPLLVDLSRIYYLDLPGTAISTLALYLLVGSDNLRRRYWALGAGVAAGLVVWTRWAGIWIIAAAFAAELVGAALASRQTESGRKPDSTRLQNGLLAVLAGVVAVIPWVLPNWPYLLSRLQKGAIYYRAEHNPDILSWASITYYLFHSIYSMLLVPWGILLGVGLVLVLTTAKLRRRHALLLWTLALGYLAYTLIGDKESRYLLPFLPVMAVFMAFWPWRLRWGGVALAIIVLVGILQWLGWLLFPINPGALCALEVHLPAPRIPAPLLANLTAYRPFYLPTVMGPPLLVTARRPMEWQWPFSAQVDSLAMMPGRSPKTVLVAFTSGYRMLSADNLNLYALYRKSPIHFAEFSPATASGEVDAIIIYLADGGQADEIFSGVKNMPQKWRLVKQDPLPGGGKAEIYLPIADQRRL